MTQALSLVPASSEAPLSAVVEYLTVRIDQQLFAIPILQVQDVLGAQKVTRVPLSPPEICGSLNLRGRIVTAIDVRCRLGLPSLEKGAPRMSVVVNSKDELYSLIFDKIGEVLALPSAEHESVPSTLDPAWRQVARGIHQLQGELLVILSIEKLITDLKN